MEAEKDGYGRETGQADHFLVREAAKNSYFFLVARPLSRRMYVCSPVVQLSE